MPAEGKILDYSIWTAQHVSTSDIKEVLRLSPAMRELEWRDDSNERWIDVHGLLDGERVARFEPHSLSDDGEWSAESFAEVNEVFQLSTVCPYQPKTGIAISLDLKFMSGLLLGTVCSSHLLKDAVLLQESGGYAAFTTAAGWIREGGGPYRSLGRKPDTPDADEQ